MSTDVAYWSAAHTLREETPLDRWFAALDGRLIEAGGRAWSLRVVGIHTLADELWIQFDTEPGSPGVVLHLGRSATVADAISALRAWFLHPRRTRRLVHV